MKSLSERLAYALALIDEAIADAASKLGTGPDNPAIRRIGGADKKLIAFNVNSSELGRAGRTGSWDPFSHDWLAQYRYARELVEKRKFSALRDLLSGHTYRDLSHGLRTFAPQVIEHVKAITGDLQAAVALTDANRLTAKALAASPHHDGSGNEVVSAEPRQLMSRRPRR